MSLKRHIVYVTNSPFFFQIVKHEINAKANLWLFWDSEMAEFVDWGMIYSTIQL